MTGTQPSDGDAAALLGLTERTLADICTLDQAVAAIGTTQPAQAWTGPAARTFHTEHLAPLASALTHARDQATTDVRTALTGGHSAGGLS